MASAGGNHTTLHNAHILAIQQYLALVGFWTCKLAGGMYQRPGLPDLIACKDGRMVAIEVKTGRAKLSAQQEQEIQRLAAAGCLTMVVASVDGVEIALLAAGLIARSYLNP